MSYCSVCANGQMTIEEGPICTLTNKIADFEKSCSSFNLDFDKKNKKIREYQIEIENNIQKRSIFLKMIVNDEPELNYLIQKPIEAKLNNIRLDNEIVISETSKNKIHLLIIGVLLIGFAGIGIYNKNFDFNNHFLVAILTITFSLGLFAIYSFITNTVLFRMNQFGLTINKNDLIPWNRINYIHFSSKRNNRFTEDFLVVRMHLGLGKDKKILINYADINPSEMGVVVYNYIKAFKVN